MSGSYHAYRAPPATKAPSSVMATLFEPPVGYVAASDRSDALNDWIASGLFEADKRRDSSGEKTSSFRSDAPPGFQELLTSVGGSVEMSYRYSVVGLRPVSPVATRLVVGVAANTGQ